MDTEPLKLLLILSFIGLVVVYLICRRIFINSGIENETTPIPKFDWTKEHDVVFYSWVDDFSDRLYWACKAQQNGYIYNLSLYNSGEIHSRATHGGVLSKDKAERDYKYTLKEKLREVAQKEELDKLSQKAAAVREERKKQEECKITKATNEAIEHLTKLAVENGVITVEASKKIMDIRRKQYDL